MSQLTAPMPACVKAREAWQYVSGPHKIISGVARRFEIPARGPVGLVQVRLLCIAANNGYKSGQEIPIELVYFTAAGNRDGAPRWSWRVIGSVVEIYFSATSIELIDSTGVIGGTFTPAQWQIKIYAMA